MPKYKKCPRCELNYILLDREYCDVCEKELKGVPDEFDVLDVDDEEQLELCPICGENMMRPGEDMCAECKSKLDRSDENEEPNPEEDDEWRTFIDDESDEDKELKGLPPEDIDDEEEEEEEEEEETPEDEEDDFDFPTGDDIYSLDDDDDEDDEDDEDDDFDDDFTDPLSSPKKPSRRKKSDEDDDL